MNFVGSFKIFGVEARQKPSITGSGAPTTETEGPVGEFYMDTDTGDVYKCTAVADGAYIWKNTNIDFVDKCCPSFAESGSVVTCDPVEGYPLNVVSHIEPVQSGSGDPSPENVRPITGLGKVKLKRMGKNLIDPVAFGQNSSISQYTDENGNLKYKVTRKDDVFTVKFDSKTLYINNRLKPVWFNPGTYTFTMFSDSSFVVNLGFYKINTDGSLGTSIGSVGVSSNTPHTFTRCEPFILTIGGNDNGYGTYSFCLQLEAGTTATEYEPYRGEEITLGLGQTVYGGSLDWKTGLLTINRAQMTFDGTEAWGYGVTSDGMFYAFLIGVKGPKSLCSHARHSYSYLPWEDGYFGASGAGYFQIISNEYNADTWKPYLAEQYANGTPVQVVYELAEPVTVQLTPQEILGLSGKNTLYSDTGDTDVSGKADPTAVFEKLTNAIIALGGNV